MNLNTQKICGFLSSRGNANFVKLFSTLKYRMFPFMNLIRYILLGKTNNFKILYCTFIYQVLPDKPVSLNLI